MITSTALVTVHHRTEYLAKTLFSIYRQTRPFDHVYVISSSKKADEIVAPYLGIKNFHYIKLPNDDKFGYAYKLNFGIGITPTDAVMYINDDDMISRRCNERLSDEMENHNVDIVYPNIQLVGMDVRYVRAMEWKLENFFKTTVPIGGVLMKTYVGKSIKYQSGLAYMDWDFWWTACEMGFTARHVDECLFIYRTHEKQWSRVCDVEKETNLVLERHPHGNS